GYGPGLLMPLVLVPIIGPEPVVPVMSLSGLFTNISRVIAFRASFEPRVALLVAACAAPLCVLGAWGYTLMGGRTVTLLLGAARRLHRQAPRRQPLAARAYRHPRCRGGARRHHPPRAGSARLTAAA